MGYELIPWRPFRELATLKDKLWNRLFGEDEPLEAFRRDLGHPLDVSETKDNIVVKADTPRRDPKEIAISCADGILTLKGERKQEKEESGEANKKEIKIKVE